MSSSLRAVLIALLAGDVSALVVGAPANRVAVMRPTSPRFGQTFMKSQEDKEFEEWMRQKKIASGVDPDEDFSAGRAQEGKIYLVGGLITILVPIIAGTWAYNNGYLTPQ